MIVENLRGKRVAITGTTGFLGTALVERLLRTVPDLHLVLLVRPGRRGAEQRVRREILKNDAFNRLREQHGDDFDTAVGGRITAIAGDVGVDGLGLDDDGRREIASCDIVIHSAATVSFDSPIDLAVEVNLLGPVRIAATLHELGVSPHLVAVSTCYVAGSRRGEAPEVAVDASPFFVDVDWRTEVDSARRCRIDTEASSREPDRLREFRQRAVAELGAAGTPALAAKTEQLRTRWVVDQMGEAGRARASSLGFPDAYAYTKSLGEKALQETKGDLRVSVVRPSIIESAMAEPVPGWIRGFRMAEPVIISYGRGLLKQFPGVPEGTVDVIPVDMVVAAIIAVAARGHEPDDDDTDIVQVASGSVNPLKYGMLVDLAQDWFTEHPLYDEKDQPIAVSAWSFPGRGRVQRQLKQAQYTIEVAEKVLHRLPLRGRQAEFGASLEERRELAERAMGYVELYGAYAECEAEYSLTRLLTLWDSLDDADRAEFCFDPRVIEWPHYVTQVHLPSVVKAGRVKTAPSKTKTQTRSERLRGQVLDPQRQLAVFDLENTLIASNVVTSHAWLASRNLTGADRLRFVVKSLAEGPNLLALDRRDRSDFLRYYYRRFENAPVHQIEADAAELFSDLILTKSFPAAIRRVRAHRAAGHRTLLITGALDFVVNPLKPLFDDIISAELGTQDGDGRLVYNGKMTDVPPTGEARHRSITDYARLHDLNLREAVAYADSASDLPMLEAVGFPVAVNPETKLASIARKRGWLIENFDKAPGGPRKLLPLAPRRNP